MRDQRRAMCLVVSMLLLLSGCTNTTKQAPASATMTPSQAHATEPAHAAQMTATGELEVVLVASELVVGLNRFAVGLFGPDGRMVDDAQVQLRYLEITGPNQAIVESVADATLLASPDGLTAIFGHERRFERAGVWGVEVVAQLPDGGELRKAIRFDVLADSAGVVPGEQAPQVDSPTQADVAGDLARLSSAFTPNPAFYERSIADALATGKPTVLLFATPGFCETRFCGPGYEIVSALQQRYGAVANFVHVEVYSGLPDPAASNWQRASAMAAYGLTTEPWLYIIDSRGLVTYRVEGLFTAEELERQLRALGLSS